MSIGRRDFMKIAAASPAAAMAFARKAPAQVGKFPKKVIILGFDGANPDFVEKWMADGLLPNLARLRGMGTYARIGTANPPQTPVSWACFATGLNPGKTGLFDFLRRDPKADVPLPELALAHEIPTRFLAGESNPAAFAAGGLVAGGLAGLAVKAVYNVIKRRMNPEEVVKLFSPATLAAAGVVGVLGSAGAAKFAADMIPPMMPGGENAVRGQTFWQFLDEKSIPTLSFRVPARFPADQLKNGRAVAGLGVLDIRKTMGTFTYYTTELLPPTATGDTEMGGKVVPLYFRPTTNETKTVVFGPANSLTLGGPKFLEKAPDDITIPIQLKDLGGEMLRITTPEWQGTLNVGQWSEPVTFTFEYNKLVKFQGYAKFYLLEMSPDVKLYLQPISFHPKTFIVSRGPMRISTPQTFVGELYDKYGPFKTLGWAADTWALNEKVIPEEVFLEDLYEYVGHYRQMMMDFVKSDEPLMVDVYSFTDRIGHMFWHHLDKAHPLYNEQSAAKYAKVMLECYQTMDSIVGDAMKALGNGIELFVLSDHGFQSFAYAFNINTWLAQNGFLGSKKGTVSKQMRLDDLFGSQQLWEHVDFSTTKAYALGLGGVYINVKGREKHGTVAPGAEYDEVCRQITEGLQRVVDPATGKRPVFKVYNRDDIYSGYDPDEMPDLRVANAPGYRCSWQSSLGGVQPEISEPNAKKWSGDHCTYEPSLTKGIFFSSRTLARTDPTLLDFFPTVLKLFGYETPGDRDGKSLV
ncbi:MAG: alkaline phosphatase family protein [Planctomycetota bacterium]|jgi:predicted AlkP superfamily phosphohydrolase/phosphomutase